MTTVALYGSSAATLEESEYQLAYAVGRALTEAGYRLMTGGYTGMMEAASKGAHKAGGHVIGVTTDLFSQREQNPITANPWVVDEVRQPTLRERLLYLVLQADAYVCMPGGLGTLQELVTVWEFIRADDIPRRPVLCYGPYWKDILQPIGSSPYFKADAWELLHFVETPSQVIAVLHREMQA